jgi:hypothetical protein
MVEFIRDNSYLISFTVLGIGWVAFKVFSHEQAAEKDRDEASFDLF